MKILLTAFLFLLLLTPYGLSKEWEVPGECPTIQAALDSCMIGDTVLVSPGVYYENIIWPNINGIKLLSQYGIPHSAIIDASDSGYVITITSGIDTSTIISGFNIRNGIGRFYFDAGGGGIYLENSSPSIIGNIIIENSAGIQCFGNSSPIIKNNTIDRNIHHGGIHLGTVLGTDSISAIIMNNIISNNSAYGGAPIGGRGGGIAIRSNLQVLVSGNTIVNNIASGGPSAPRGAGIYCENTSPIITDNIIVGNKSHGWGGGIYCDNSSPIITRCYFSQNSSATGCIHSNNNSYPSIDSCIIVNNYNDGIYCSSGSNIIVNYSDIFNNIGFGLKNLNPHVVNAENNWWGHNSGPFNPNLNPSGLGEEISGYVDFEP
jgi:parallel beta-helix repeat protein